MREKVPPPISPDKLVEMTLSNSSLRNLLRVEGRSRTLMDVRPILDQYSDRETLALTEFLIRGLGSDDESTWNVDRRDGALVMLGAIPYENKHINPNDLSKIYVQQLQSQRGPMDPLGRVSALIEAGEILFPYFPANRKFINRATKALDLLDFNLEQREGKSDVSKKINELKAKINDSANRKKRKPISSYNPSARFTLPDLPKRANRTARSGSKDIHTIIHRPRTRESPSEKVWAIDTNELELIEAAKNKDSGAFKILVERTYKDLISLANSLMRDEDDARDVVQEAYLKAYLNINRFKGEAQFSTWMFRITTNVAMNHLKKRKKHIHEDIDTTTSKLSDDRVHTDPQAMAEAGVIRERLTRSLAQLPSRWRDVIILSDVCGHPQDDIARMLGIDTGNVKVLLHRARRRLRDMLLPKPKKKSTNNEESQ